MQAIAERGIEVLIPTDGTLREGKRPWWADGLYARMRQLPSTERGKALYRQRKRTVELVYGQIKYNRRIDRFRRRGGAAARSEWRLVAATHNLLKLHSHLDRAHRLTRRRSPQTVSGFAGPWPAWITGLSAFSDGLATLRSS
jgi:hypothetical protein